MTHTTLLNYLIDKYGLKSYLEIGVRTTEQNFDKINCERKVGCDPNVTHELIAKVTSDNFFTAVHNFNRLEHFNELYHYDIIFIDGLHHSDQVERDFNNSLKCLNDGGFIILHDTCPTEEQYTKVPRETKIWYGDVFSFAMNLGRYNGLNFITLDEDCGITIVWKLREVTIPETYNYSWQDYQLYKHTLLQVGTIEQFDRLVFKKHVQT